MLNLPAEFTPDFMVRLEQLRLKTRREYAVMGMGGHPSLRRGTSLGTPGSRVCAWIRYYIL